MAQPALQQVVYASSARRLWGPDDLADLLRVSRTFNAANGVTGALLYATGNIMQAIEGPPDTIEALYGRIRADPRHWQVTTLLNTPTPRRSYPDWAMGLLDLSHVPKDDREALRPILELLQVGPDRAHRMLATFRTLLPGLYVPE